MTLLLTQFEIGPMQNFGYLIGDRETKRALIVDPAWSTERIFALLKESELELAGLVVTHAHYDHTNAIEAILKTKDVPVYANRAEIDYARSGTSIVGSLGRTVKAMDGGDKIQIGGVTVELLHTPGHTPGSQCLLVGGHLITGDTLFVGGCGRSDLPGGDPAALFRSLKKIGALPANLEVCPGHDYGDVPRHSLEDELRINPYLRLQDESAFLNAVSA